MSDAEISALVAELRADYQLPPYMGDQVISRSVSRVEHILEGLRPGSNFAADPVGRGLLKDGVYYDLNHRLEEFQGNYLGDILQWQLSKEVDSEDTGE